MMRFRTATILALALLALWGCNYRMSPDGEREEDARVSRPAGLRAQSFKPSPVTDELLIVPRLTTPQEGVPSESPSPQMGPGRTGAGKLFPEEDRIPEAPRGGTLLTREQGRIVPLPLQHTDVKAQLTFMIGSVSVTQQYHNPYGGKIEAVYVFPLPDDAAVRDFILQIGDRRIRGIIREREEATRIYLEARRQGKVASLMTQERPNIFTQRVANIEPGKRIDVQITYFHTLRYKEGTFEFVYPMVVGPRYNPPGFSNGVGAVAAGTPRPPQQATEMQYLAPDQISAADIAFDVAIDAGTEIVEITSPTHALKTARTGAGRASVTLSPNDRIPNRDFILRYKVSAPKISAGLAVHSDEAGGTFALMIHPPESLQDVPRTAREMIFVIDCSGSMNGRPVEVAKRALVKCLKRLEADDSFQILRFSDRVTAFGRAPLQATAENVRSGVAFTESLFTDGGTEMQEVIRIALDTPVAPGRRRIVSLLTDGFIGNDREVVAFTRAHLGNARLFSFGVGDSVNRYLLEALARVGRGVSTFITLDEASETAADELFKRVEHPVMTDLRIDWGGMNVTDVQPSPLPDLYLGRPVVLYGRFKGAGPRKVQVSGRAGERTVELALAVTSDEAGSGPAALPAAWARTKIAGLYDALLGTSDAQEIVPQIRLLALQHGLLSEFTAFVAVDSLSRTAGEFGTTVVQPVPVPNGVQYSTTVDGK